ncbi:nucleoside 2-deoxyribosyltransferase [Streptomyces sp. URMC 123]|uniref:nucleoside 2-deoxyribosyltransferase n=1 Tax=Streptomyces sp. URMC 123 TaxID=3423403 RepID=UPI003F1BDFF5
MTTAPLHPVRALGVTSVFVAGPFTQLLDPATGAMSGRVRAPFATLIEHFESHGFEVHNAHRREAWGAELMSPDECTELDQKEIEKADAFVAFPGSPASPGTHIEIGWASAYRKPMVLLLEEAHEYAFLIDGLHTVASVEYVRYSDVRTALPAIDTALHRAVTRHHNTSPAPAPLA